MEYCRNVGCEHSCAHSAGGGGGTGVGLRKTSRRQAGRKDTGILIRQGPDLALLAV